MRLVDKLIFENGIPDQSGLTRLHQLADLTLSPLRWGCNGKTYKVTFNAAGDLRCVSQVSQKASCCALRSLALLSAILLSPFVLLGLVIKLALDKNETIRSIWGRKSRNYVEMDSGKFYIGELVGNRLHGRGILYREDGTVKYDGHWENGEFIPLDSGEAEVKGSQGVRIEVKGSQGVRIIDTDQGSQYLCNRLKLYTPDQLEDPGSEKYEKITYMSLAYNYFEELPQWLGKLKNLQQLRLDNNSFSEIPADVFKLHNLKDLHIDDMRYSNSSTKFKWDDKVDPKKFKVFKNLQTLSLRGLGAKINKESLKKYLPADCLVLLWK